MTPAGVYYCECRRIWCRPGDKVNGRSGTGDFNWFWKLGWCYSCVPDSLPLKGSQYQSDMEEQRMTEEREKHATKLDRLKHETEMRWGHRWFTSVN